MNKELKYSGLSVVPSDYECPDGQLAASINVIPEDGHLKPMQLPEPLFTMPNNYELVFIHKTSSFSNFIVKQGSFFHWIEEPTVNSEDKLPKELKSTAFKGLAYFNEYYEIKAIGNTLLFLTPEGIHYLLFKNRQYIKLGTHLPECNISFSLSSEFVWSEKFAFELSPSYSLADLKNTSLNLDEGLNTRITDAVLAKVNKFIAENSIQKGRFIFPFFVRYAYRLYDGSLTMHSAPIFMCATSAASPRCSVVDYSTSDGKITQYYLRLFALCSKLNYSWESNTDKETFELWSDIISSVDVFISAPIYSYDQAGRLTAHIVENHYDTGNAENIFTVCNSTNNIPGLYSGKISPYDAYLTVKNTTYTTDDIKNDKYTDLAIAVPYKPQNEFIENIQDNSLFYFLKSLSISEIDSGRKDMNVPENYLQSLVAREVMSDDYQSHDTIIPSIAFDYNGRLNLSGISRIPYAGYPPFAMLAQAGYSRSVDIYIYVKTERGDIIRWNYLASSSGLEPVLWLYYPDPKAYKAIVVIDRNTLGATPKYYEVQLKPHSSLNGAYYFGPWEGACASANSTSGPIEATEDTEALIPVPNKIYTSEINNPFYFPVTGITTVGTGKILGLSTAAKALSQGQFGQFPLYAFTSEGIWALEVSSTGTYSARQPITRDVCINKDGITQLDSSVVFPTDRGIMMIAGSNVECISDIINSESPFNALSLPSFSELHDMLGHLPQSDKCLPTLPFSKFLKEGRIIYDYVHQRIVVYNPEVTYAYVFSMKSKQWGMVFSNIKSHINSYPDALAIDNTNHVLNFSTNSLKSIASLILTRPIKLDAPDTFKTIDTIIQRGNFERGHVKSVLYGSRNLRDWHLIWSSVDHYLRGFRGTPYKYFRVALVGNLTPEESIYGASVRFTPRLMDHLR